jgi:hypothetical protein
MRHTAAVGLTVAALALTGAGCDLHTQGGHTMQNSSSTTSTCIGLPSECGQSYWPAPRTTTTTTAAPLPTPQDFTLDVIEMSRQCFGDAGCSVQYRIVPTYQRAGSVPTGRYSLLYELDGGDEPQSGNIQVRNGQYHTEEGYLSTTTSGGTLTAHVTQVLEN